MPTTRRCLAAVLLMGCVALRARSDGGDMRPATPAEEEFSRRALTVLSQALPRLPPGFEAQSATRVAAAERVPTGSEAAPMPVFYSVLWVNPEEATRERTQQDAAVSRAFAKGEDPAVKERRTALTARVDQLAKELGKALEANDQARVAELKRQVDASGRELTQLSQGEIASLSGETRSPAHRSRLGIAMRVNTFDASQPARLIRALQPVTGHLAYAFHDPEGRTTDRTTVLVGPWRQGTGPALGRYTAAAVPGTSTRARTVAVTVTGDPLLAGQVLAGVDWRSLQELVE